jgi:hypothetical protein
LPRRRLPRHNTPARGAGDGDAAYRDGLRNEGKATATTPDLTRRQAIDHHIDDTLRPP